MALPIPFINKAKPSLFFVNRYSGAMNWPWQKTRYSTGMCDDSKPFPAAKAIKGGQCLRSAKANYFLTPREYTFTASFAPVSATFTKTVKSGQHNDSSDVTSGTAWIDSPQATWRLNPSGYIASVSRILVPFPDPDEPDTITWYLNAAMAVLPPFSEYNDPDEEWFEQFVAQYSIDYFDSGAGGSPIPGTIYNDMTWNGDPYSLGSDGGEDWTVSISAA